MQMVALDITMAFLITLRAGPGHHNFWVFNLKCCHHACDYASHSVSCPSAFFSVATPGSSAVFQGEEYSCSPNRSVCACVYFHCKNNLHCEAKAIKHYRLHSYETNSFKQSWIITYQTQDKELCNRHVRAIYIFTYFFLYVWNFRHTLFPIWKILWRSKKIPDNLDVAHGWWMWPVDIYVCFNSGEQQDQKWITFFQVMD